MLNIAVASGKGGAGKTSVSAALARYFGQAAIPCDCDVDAANTAIALDAVVRSTEDYWAGDGYQIDPASCIGCDACAEVCRFNACIMLADQWGQSPLSNQAPRGQSPLSNQAPRGQSPLSDQAPRGQSPLSNQAPRGQSPLSDPQAQNPLPEGQSSHKGPIRMIDAALCERCAACLDVCPVNAVRAVPKLGGRLYVSDVPGGSLLVHAALIPGEDTSGKLVRAVRQRAEAVANGNTALLIMDAPPGIGCPVIASLSAVDLVVVVIEAGNSGIRDAQRLFQLLASMKRHSVSIINKAGIDPELDTHATALAARYQSPVLATIPFDRRFRESTERSEAWIGSPDPEVRQPALAMCQALAQALDLGSLSTHPIRPQGGHT